MPAEAPSPDAPSRLHLWSGLIVLGTFLAGAAAGAGAMAWLRLPPRHGQPPGGLPPPIAALELTAEQQRQVQVILDKHRPELEAVLMESFPRLRALQEQTDQEIRPLLTEAQARRFDELKARVGQSRERGGPFPFGPGGPGGPGGSGGPPPGPPPGADPGAPPPGPPAPPAQGAPQRP